MIRFLPAFLLLGGLLHAQDVKQVPMLSPADELKTIQLPDGYRLELVLSEPQIQEPVVCAFDGNGRMYVAEMRTYMQDIDGKDELTPTSRISRHESSKGDGVFDKHSVYLDHQLLPRMILPLDDRVLVGITNTTSLTIHEDKNHDGVADAESVWFEGKISGSNLEHQQSGLVWGVDNWIYTTYNNYRLRWNGNGKPALQEPTAGNGGQWGLTQDDYGKMWWSNAGGEKGIWNFQTPIVYAAINVSSQKTPDFDTVWPLVALGDFQGGTGRFHAPDDPRLNHFTGCGGQTIYRGDALPNEMYGSLFLPEPVGRLIRHAKVEVKDGITVVSNPYGQSEFIRSTDPNFRPLNTVTGPDGCLYIVDMYRGIIQEGNWVREGSFLREKVKENGLQNNTGKGRIWRLVHKDHKPGPQPHMLEETPAQLVTHLAHPNGWWRDTAQRMLIIKADPSVVPALISMAQTHENHLARLHALWTLEGLGALSKELVRLKLHDDHPMLRAAAIRAAEGLIKAKADPALVTDILALSTDKDPTVALQVMMTGKLLNWPDWKQRAQSQILMASAAGVREIGAQLLVEPPRLTGSFTKDERKSVERGQEIFRSLCFACHGFDGRGMPMPGREGVVMAPPLAGSRTVAQGDALLRVLLHGLMGPIEGKTYEALMVPMGMNNDEWLADVASYVRKSFDNSGPMVTKDEIKKLRAATKGRTTPWTIEELRAAYPSPLPDRTGWKLTASVNEKDLPKALDGDAATRWSTNAFQKPGQWLQIELPAETEVAGVELDTTKSRNDYPRKYEVLTSNDGATWSRPLLKGDGTQGLKEFIFSKPVTTKFLRINQSGSASGNYWSVHELQVLRPPVNVSAK